MKNYTVSLAIKILANWQVDVKAKNESEAKRKALKAFEKNDGENIDIEELEGYGFEELEGYGFEELEGYGFEELEGYGFEELEGYGFEDIDVAFDSKTKAGIAIIEEF